MVGGDMENMDERECGVDSIKMYYKHVRISQTTETKKKKKSYSDCDGYFYLSTWQNVETPGKESWDII